MYIAPDEESAHLQFFGTKGTVDFPRGTSIKPYHVGNDVVLEVWSMVLYGHVAAGQDCVASVYLSGPTAAYAEKVADALKTAFETAVPALSYHDWKAGKVPGLIE